MNEAPERVSLRRGTIAVVAGNGVFNACRIGVVVLLAKLAPAEVLGAFNYGAALAAPIVIALCLELRSVYVADPTDATSFGAYRALRLLGLGAASLLLAIAVLWHARVAAGWAIVTIVAGACAAKVLLHHADIYWGVYQKRERLDLLGWSNAVRGVLMLAVFALALAAAKYVRADANTIAWIVAAAGVACALGWWVVTIRMDRPFAQRVERLSKEWTRDDLLRLAREAAPLGVTVCLISLCDNLPALLIGSRSGGHEALGYFGALAYIPMAAMFLVVQAGTAATHQLAQRYRADRRAFLRLIGMMFGGALLVGGAAISAAWLLGRLLLTLLYTPDYAAHFDAFLVVVAAQCALLPAIVAGFVLTAMRRFWLQVPMQLVVLTVTAIASVQLIPADPIGGGAYAMLIRAAVQSLLYVGMLCVALRGIPRADSSRG